MKISKLLKASALSLVLVLSSCGTTVPNAGASVSNEQSVGFVMPSDKLPAIKENGEFSRLRATLEKSGINIDSNVRLSEPAPNLKTALFTTSDPNISIIVAMVNGQVGQVSLIKRESEERAVFVNIGTQSAYRVDTNGSETRLIEQGFSANSSSLVGMLSIVQRENSGVEPSISAQGCVVPTDLISERDFARREESVAKRNVDIALGAYGLSLTSIAACVGGPWACAVALGSVVIAGSTLGSALDSWKITTEKLQYAQSKIDSWKRSQTGCNWA